MGTKNLALFIISIAQVMKLHTKPRKVPDLDTPIITKSIVGVSTGMKRSRTKPGEALPGNKEIKIPLYKVFLMKSTSLPRALREGKEEPPPPNAFPPWEIFHECYTKWATTRSVVIQEPGVDV